MNTTLHLLDELLEHDPGSRIFLPLAKLYRKEGQLRKSAEIVTRGLEHHPDYLEAQIFLIETLHDLGDSAAEAKAESLFFKLAGYEKFWGIARRFFARSQKNDLALAALLLERSSHQEHVDLIQVLSLGLAHSEELTSSPSAVTEPDEDLDAEEVAQLCINSGIKTKTMAKLLMAQGEYAQAAAIYDALLASCPSDADREELRTLQMSARAAMGERQDEGNSKLFQVLSSLATRLEEKAQSASDEND